VTCCDLHGTTQWKFKDNRVLRGPPVGNSSDNSPLQDSTTNSNARRPDVVIFPEHEDMMYSSDLEFTLNKSKNALLARDRLL
jgi:hypothetical protein